MTSPDAKISQMDQAALAYENKVGGDCLNSRTRPGTPVGECIYVFCGCNINEAFLAGVQWRDSHPSPAVLGLVEALRQYRNECENKVPDALYKRTLREKLFSILSTYEESLK